MEVAGRDKLQKAEETRKDFMKNGSQEKHEAVKKKYALRKGYRHSQRQWTCLITRMRCPDRQKF